MKLGLAPALLLCALAAGPAVLATEAADAARLRLIVATCQICHSAPQDGAAIPGIPGLESLAPDALRALLEAYKTGKTPATIMDRIAKGLTDEEIAGISVLFGPGEE